MQRKRRKNNYKEFPDSSGNRHNLHSIPTLGMSEKSGAGVESSNRNAREDIYQPTSVRVKNVASPIVSSVNVAWWVFRNFKYISHFTHVVRWTSPHLKIALLRSFLRASFRKRKQVFFSLNSYAVRTRSSREMTPYGEMQRYPEHDQSSASRVVMTPLSKVVRYLRPLPYLSIVSLLVLSFLALTPNLYSNDSVYATEDTNAGVSGRATSAGLSVSATKLTETVSPGSTVYVNNTVSVNAKDIESYSLTISGPTTMKNGSTTINGSGGNTPSSMGDNTWGYAWDSSNNGSGFTDSSATYNSLPGTNTSQKLTTPALSNYGVEFSRKLGFAAKFAEDADPGHYIADITLSLVATPRTLGVWSTGQAAGISTMQQMNTAICNQVPTPAAGATDVPTMTLLDSRDGNYYNIAKYADGRCWMQENLRIAGTTIKAAESDFSGSDITLPSSAKSDFTDANKFTYRSILLSEANSGSTGYYNWYTATAGAGNSSFNSGNVSTSICPKGWTLPTGGRENNVSNESTWSDYYKLFRKMGLSISNSSLMPGSGTNWGTGDLAIIQGDIYNFKYPGGIFSGSLGGNNSNGYWWSSTATGSYAFLLDIDNRAVYPGTNGNFRYAGIAVRCVAKEPDLSGITTMQEMTPGVCEKTPLISGQKYSEEYTLTDDRTYPSGTDKTYKVRKFADGRCWMTENLRINNTTLKAASSDFSGSDIVLPNSGKGDFANNDTSKYNYRSYLSTSSDGANAGVSGYYNWYTATAGAGSSSVTAQNQNVNTSICPKGWTLPTGGRAGNANTESTWSDCYKLFRNMGLTISTSSLSTAGSTNWGSGDLAIVQGDVYNFKYTGRVSNGSFYYGSGLGYWWSSTAYDAYNAYDLNIDSNNVNPGTDSNLRYYGFAVRCIARDS